jgi:Fur family iron response transcriptional regulator
MELSRPSPTLVDRLRHVGLRPTRQRVALARLLFEGGDRHVSAEQLHGEAAAAAIRVSLATV